MDEITPRNPFPPCPNCGSANTRRGLRRRTEELALNRMMFQVPYHCPDCKHRFFSFRVPKEPKEKPKQPYEP